MEAYVRVKKERQDEEIQENEVRITAINKVRNYITYAMTLLEEKGHSSVVLKAMGKAINKTVVVAEILKRRTPGLHQLTEISSTNIVDVWEPKEEGLDRLETTRRVSVIVITLSKEPLDTAAVGYQPPLPEDQVRPLDPDELGEAGQRPRRPRGRGRGRGRGRAPGEGGGYEGGGGEEGPGGHEHAGEEGAHAGDGHRGRGRGRRGRGRGRGRGPPGGHAGGEGAEGGAEGADGFHPHPEGGEHSRGRRRHRRGGRGGGGGGGGGGDAAAAAGGDAPAPAAAE